jgi:hypothetical protein
MDTRKNRKGSFMNWKHYLLLGYILFSFTSCSVFSIGKRGVYYKEMSKAPEIVTLENGFLVYTENSKENSALLIYKIKAKINKTNREITLKAYQALGKKFKNKFDISVKRISKAELDTYDFIWINPDKSRNKLKIKK